MLSKQSVLVALRAFTGNMDIDGGNFFYRPYSKLVSMAEMSPGEMLSAAQYKKALGMEKFRVLSRQGVNLLVGAKTLFVLSSLYLPVMPEIRTGDPYRVRVLFTMACNPMVTAPNTRGCCEGLKHHLHLHVSMETVMTSTAMLANYVLPITIWPERTDINWLADANSIIVGQRLMPKSMPGMYGRRDDYDV